MLFCTVIAQNFLPHARVLAESLAEHHPGCRLDVLVLDAPEPSGSREPFRWLSFDALPLSRAEINRRRTMYDIAALGSSLRGPLLEACLARNEGPVLYLDADMLVLAPLDDVEALAQRHGIVLTPHSAVPLPFQPNGFGPEQGFLHSGVFNGGCLAVSSAAADFLKWRDQRVARDCVWAPERNIVMGQAWLSLVPALFDHVALRDRGVNLSGHGMIGDDLTWRDDRPWIGETPVRLFHFGGGFDPRVCEVWHSASPPPWWPRTAERPGLKRLCELYGRRLLEAGFDARPAPASSRLDAAMRQAYREALIAAEARGSTEPPNPFENGEAAFTAWLERRVADSV